MKPYNLFALNIVEILLKLTVNTNQSPFSNHYVKPIFLGFPPINHVQFASTLICFFREFMIYLCYLYIFTHTVVQHTFNLRWCSCGLTVTRRVALEEQELLNLPRHPRFECSNISCLCNALYIIACPFVLFQLAIALSVLRIKISEYPISIFKFSLPW